MSEETVGGRFIGRRRELDRWRAALRRCRDGHGAVLAVAGEPGIGKTALLHRFLTEAGAVGATAVGSCAVEGEWRPPYGCWADILEQVAAAVAPVPIVDGLGAAGPLLTRLAPGLGTSTAPAPAALQPVQERVRLFDAAARFLAAAAAPRPLVVAIDDLQWLDADSLALLRVVARSCARAGVLLVVLYRHRDGESRPALADLVDRLRRESDGEELVLRGWSAPEVGDQLVASAGAQVPPAVVSAVHAATDGNPFFVRELWRHLVDSGQLRYREQRWSTDFSIAELGIPDSVRHVVGRRIAGLGGAARDLLTSAAAFTGPFTVAALGALLDVDEPGLLDALDAAIAAGLVHPVPVPGSAAGYAFSHAIVRYAVLDRLNPDRVARLHRAVAGSLERAGGTAAELAYQYHASAGVPGAERGVHWCLAAAEAARADAGHAMVARYLAMAVDLAPPGERPDLLCRLAIAQADAAQLDDALRSAARARDALAGSSAATVAFLARFAGALKDAGAAPAQWVPVVAAGLRLVGDDRDLAWARLTLLQDRMQPLGTGRLRLGGWLGVDPEAARIAREAGDEDDAARALEPYDVRGPAETARVLAQARTWRSPTARLRGLDVAARDLCYRQGDVRAGTEVLTELLAESERYGSLHGRAEALTQLALCQGLLGELDTADHTRERAAEIVATLGPGHRLHVVVDVALGCILGYLRGSAPWALLGERAERGATDPATAGAPVGFTFGSFAVLAHGRAGAGDAADRVVADMIEAMEQVRPDTYLLNGAAWCVAAGVWELGGSRFVPRLRLLTDRLLDAGITAGPARSLEVAAARLAALDGDLDAAVEWFARARRVLDAAGQRPMSAIVDRDEAVVARRHGRQGTALREAALSAFGRLGMVGWARDDQEAAAPVGGPALTVREAEVLELLAAGRTNREIAAALVVAEPTVRRHVANIYRKVGTRNRAEATAYALRHTALPL
ncbi:ATP-binding protein [Pseudonocardia saturnea]